MDRTNTLVYRTVTAVPADRWRDGEVETVSDQLAEEIPIALVYNGISHAVMLASPQDLEDFAIGFSLTEGIIGDSRDIYECEIIAEAPGISIQLKISSERMVMLRERRRSTAGRTGCGLCGTESLQQAIRLPPSVPSGASFPVRSFHAAFDKLQAHQVLQQQTGATHAAIWVTSSGDISIVREDVGRHNALDKLIGALHAMNVDLLSGAVIVTSRASYEMVQKISMARIPILAAISAPTGLAVQMARACNVTLVGFAREGRHTVYSGSSRLVDISGS